MISVGGMELLAREMEETDLGYVITTARREIRSVPQYRHMSDGDFYRVVEGFRDRVYGATSRIVLSLPEDAGFIVAFAVGDPSLPRLDFLNVRGAFRGLGIGRVLADMMNVRHGEMAAVSYPTWDLIRLKPGKSHPLGLLHNERWRLRLLED